MDEAIFYPKQGKILINAHFYSFWISIEEFKKYNLKYKIADDKYRDKTIETKIETNIEKNIEKIENRTREIKI